MEKVIIDEDMAAQEMGYEKAASKTSPGKNSFSARFDGSSGKYVFVRPSITIDLAKKKSSDDKEYIKSLEIEEEYSNEFFDLYTKKVNETVEGIEVHIKDKDALDKIMSMSESKMSGELANEAAVIAEAKNSEAYVMACGIDWDDDNWKVTDTRAIEWFKENDRFFFANQFKHYKDDLKTVVENELKGIERAYDPAVVKRLEKKMGDVFNHPQIQDYYELVIRNAVNRSRNYGRVAKFQRLKIAEIEIVAILDKKTSTICRVMNGRRLKVQEMADYVEKTIEAPLDELKEKFGWPSDSTAREFASMGTADIMKKIGCKLPPYHGRCRTTTIASMSTRVTSNSGTELNTMREPAARGMNDKARRAIKTKNAERWAEYKNLTTDEWSSKISALTASQWDEASLESHWSKHKKDFDNYSNGVKLNDMKEYEAFSKKMLQDFNRCFIYRHRGFDRVMFLNSKDNCAVMVDAGSSRIVSCYPLKPGQKESYQNQFMELVNGKE
jgi:Mn-dependent DtxR family transcriptional regulator